MSITVTKLKAGNAAFSKFEGWPDFTDDALGSFSDELLECLQEGRVKPVAAISEFMAGGVKLVNGEIIELDKVVLATG